MLHCQAQRSLKDPETLCPDEGVGRIPFHHLLPLLSPAAPEVSRGAWASALTTKARLELMWRKPDVELVNRRDASSYTPTCDSMLH